MSLYQLSYNIVNQDSMSLCLVREWFNSRQKARTLEFSELQAQEMEALYAKDEQVNHIIQQYQRRIEIVQQPQPKQGLGRALNWHAKDVSLTKVTE